MQLKYRDLVFQAKAMFAEFVGTTLFIFQALGCKSPLGVGLQATSVVYATSSASGGQLNPIVTTSLYLVGALSPLQAVGNVLAQSAGALVGSALLQLTLPDSKHGDLGANALVEGVSVANAFIGELLMTCMLVFVVLETAVNQLSKVGVHAAIPIGLAIYLGNAVLGPIDGASLNPIRALGPAVVSGIWDDFWVFVTAPFVGSLLAVALHFGLKEKDEPTVHVLG